MGKGKPYRPGNGVLFRWSYRHYRSGKIVRPKNGRPFPIPFRKRKR